LFIQVPLTPQHALQAVLYGVGQVQIRLTVGVTKLLIPSQAGDFELSIHLILIISWLFILLSHIRKDKIFTDLCRSSRDNIFIGSNCNLVSLEVAASLQGLVKGEELTRHVLFALLPAVINISGKHSEQISALEVHTVVSADTVSRWCLSWG